MDYMNLNFDENDYLERKIFCENITDIIEIYEKLDNENNSLVLAIDSPWGTGKSYLINMWKNMILSEEFKDKNFSAMIYNAWENDDSDNAFIPLVYKLQDLDSYSEGIKIAKSLESRSKNFLKNCGVAFLKDSIKKYIGEETAGIINDGIEGFCENSCENDLDFFDKYKLFMDEKKRFKEALEGLVPKNGKLIIFIDELDRCRPNFAIETLEIVKHYFNVENVVFIFSVDIIQLSHSISTMYGAGMDACGYLRRFFDINIKIPYPNKLEYLRKKINSPLLKEIIGETFFEKMSALSDKMDLTLRDTNKILNNFIIFCLYYKNKIVKGNSNDTLEIYLYFMILKYKHAFIYNLILTEDYVAYDNKPVNWYVLEYKYFATENISKLLHRLQTGKARQLCTDIFKEFKLFDNGSPNVSFSEHIQNTIEMFM